MTSIEKQLIDGAKSGDYGIVKQLLEAHPDINANIGDPNGYTPLNCASWFGHLKVVDLLANHPDVDVNQGARINETPLFVACQEGHVGLIKMLLKHPKILVNKTTSAGASPFYIACEKGHAEVVKILINDGRANPNRCRDSGASPLFIACQEGKTEVVKILLTSRKIKLSVNKTRNDGVTPLWMASQKGCMDIVKWLLSGNEEVNTSATWSGNNCPASQQARIFGYHAVANLIERYQQCPRLVRRELRKELKVGDREAAEVFSLFVLFSDEYTELKEKHEKNQSETARFFQIARDIPQELQMVLANKMMGLDSDFILGKHLEEGVREALLAFEMDASERDEQSESKARKQGSREDSF